MMMSAPLKEWKEMVGEKEEEQKIKFVSSVSFLNDCTLKERIFVDSGAKIQFAYLTLNYETNGWRMSMT
jgi:hypothetical protein